MNMIVPGKNTSVKMRDTQGFTEKIKSRKMTRANFITICGVSSVCILLFIAAQHNTRIINSFSSPSLANSRFSPNTYFIQKNKQQQIPHLNKNNFSTTIADILTAQRSKIIKEMENFEYPFGRFGVDAEKLSDLTPETDGIPVRSLIVTSWRSGSTFLGDILNAMPGNYYHYEPLLDYGIVRIRDHNQSMLAVNHLKKLLFCDYSNMESYLSYGKTHTYLFEHNERLWSVCKEHPHICWRGINFLTPFCKLFPLQSMKTVRLPLIYAGKILEDKSLGARIILLVRDPRGTIQSRKHRSWCGGSPDCEDPLILCKDLVDDYRAAETLINKFPNRFRTLRYEDLSINPYEMTQEILQFYGLPFDPLVEDFLDTHTKINIGGVSSTYRDSKLAPFHWKNDLNMFEIKYIQNSCIEAMELWRYKQILNFTGFQRNSDLITLPPPFS